MSDARHRERLASDLWFAHLQLTRGSAEERAWALDEADRLLAEIEKSPPLDYVEAARAGDAVALDGLAVWLDIVRRNLERPAASPKPTRPRGQRRPSVAMQIKQAEKAGKNVASVTTPEGVTLTFGQEPTEASNPWLADLDKVSKQ